MRATFTDRMSAPGTLVPPSGLKSASPAGSVMALTGAVDSYGVSRWPVLALRPVFWVTTVSSAAPWWSAAVSVPAACESRLLESV